jgi:hypothetical protein
MDDAQEQENKLTEFLIINCALALSTFLPDLTGAFFVDLDCFFEVVEEALKEVPTPADEVEVDAPALTA